MWLTTAQAARKLGVKPETLYAYVSRGLLSSKRAKGRRGSMFDAAEVNRLAERKGGRQAPRDTGSIVRSELTMIKDNRLSYRGQDATTLAHHPFEAVATLLWTGELPAEATFTAPKELVALARKATAPLPPTTRLVDRLRVITAVASSADPYRFHTQPEAVIATAATLLAAMVDVLPLEGPKEPKQDNTLAARLWSRLSARPAVEAGVGALNAALVLLADHGLATSTMAARVAASARAHPYAVVSAGLSAMDGPLHGTAPTQAYRLLEEAITTGDPVGAYAERLRTEGRVVGFFDQGHPLYPAGDIRASALLSFVDSYPVPLKVKSAIDGLREAAAQRSPRTPNVDFALAALTHACGMRADAGEAIFAIARTAGWIAHALEEYQEAGLRFRVFEP